jgi:hypothetical protein
MIVVYLLFPAPVQCKGSMMVASVLWGYEDIWEDLMLTELCPKENWLRQNKRPYSDGCNGKVKWKWIYEVFQLLRLVVLTQATLDKDVSILPR